MTSLKKWRKSKAGQIWHAGCSTVNIPHSGQSKGKPMFDRQFFRSKLGMAAALSVAAMLAMNIVALNAQLHAVPSAYAASAQTTVELA